uniref:Chloride channel protein n=1 Tax=Otus sunia TaxID=257818 RepID=A0A8C8B2G5_9STRI
MEHPVPGGLRGEKEEERVLVSQQSWRPCPEAQRRLRGCLEWVKRQLFRVGEDWYFLFVLGVLMATISFMMDLLVSRLYEAHRWLYQEVGDILVLKYLSWTIYPTALAAFSTGFSQSITPHSGGSGIPELKTILTGVVLEDYLAIQNFGAKVVGLTCTLACGSTIFLGKVGPFVHLSAMAAAYLGKMRTSVMGEYENKFKQNEMLVAAQAVGVATVFGAPISGEDWLPPHPGTPKLLVGGYRGFIQPWEWGYIQAGGVWELYPALGGGAASSLRVGYRGCIEPCELGGCIQPQGGCRMVMSSCTIPGGGGGLLGSPHLLHPPPPAILGAAIGRLLGEMVALLFPRGLRSEGDLHPVIPGGYALAGAAAFSGSVTHAISTALLVCEATGHLGHVLPVVLAVLVANAITQKHQPSFYDGTIIVKKLPYLPPIRSRHMASYQVVVEEFMEHRVVALAMGDGFEEVLVALDASTDRSPTLVGTVSRTQLVTFLQSHKHPQAPQGEKLATAGTLGDSCTVEPIILQLSPWTSLHQV